MPAAARLGDKAQVDADAHGCPACPHPGVGPIVTGSPDVFVNDQAVARQDDLGIHAVCCGPNNFTIKRGSATVYVNGKPFARMNDQTKHCGGSGPIIEGSPDVFVDDGASGQGLAASALNALRIQLQSATPVQPGQQRRSRDTHTTTSPAGQQNLASTAAQGFVTSARWSMQRAKKGVEVHLWIECTKNLTGSLTIEIWLIDEDNTPSKKVHTLQENAATSVKPKWKVEIPPGSAGLNEVEFRFIVKDANGRMLTSDTLFVERSRFSFSV